MIDDQEMDAKLVGTTNVIQPSFMIPPRINEAMMVISTIPPSLSNSMNKKYNFKPFSMPVKDIVTKYATRTLKNKKLKNHACLTNDIITRKVIEELATYR